MKTKITTIITSALAALLLCACTTTAQVPPANSIEIKQRDAAGAAWEYPAIVPQPNSALTFGSDRKPASTLLSTFASASALTLLDSSVGALQTQVATHTGKLVDAEADIAALQTALAGKQPAGAALSKITEGAGLPLWNGAAWPGAGVFPINGNNVSITNPSPRNLSIAVAAGGNGSIILDAQIGGSVILKGDTGAGAGTLELDDRVALYGAYGAGRIGIEGYGEGQDGVRLFSANPIWIRNTAGTLYQRIKIAAGAEADDAVNKTQLDAALDAAGAAQETAGNALASADSALYNSQEARDAAASAQQALGGKQDAFAVGAGLALASGTLSATATDAGGKFPLAGNQLVMANPGASQLVITASSLAPYTTSYWLTSTLAVSSTSFNYTAGTVDGVSIRLRVDGEYGGGMTHIENNNIKIIAHEALQLSERIVSTGSAFSFNDRDWNPAPISIASGTLANQAITKSQLDTAIAGVGGAGFPLAGNGVSITNPDYAVFELRNESYDNTWLRADGGHVIISDPSNSTGITLDEGSNVSVRAGASIQLNSDDEIHITGQVNAHMTAGEYVNIRSNNSDININAGWDVNIRSTEALRLNTENQDMSMTAENGSITMSAPQGSVKLHNLAAPADGADAATKGYVDTAIAGAGGGGSTVWTQSGNNIYYNSGNVGIGTASPRGGLEIYNSSNAQASWPRVILGGATVASALVAEQNGQTLEFGVNYNQASIRNTSYPGAFFRIDTRSGYIGNQMFSIFHVPANGSEAVKFKLSSGGDGIFGGKVGIGKGADVVNTSAPSYALDVSGDINFTGVLRKNGSEWSPGGGLPDLNESGAGLEFQQAVPTGRYFFGKPTYIMTVWKRPTPSDYSNGDFTVTVPNTWNVDDIVDMGGWVDNAIDHYRVAVPTGRQQIMDAALWIYKDPDGIIIERNGGGFGEYIADDWWFKIWVEFTKSN
jgi:hypothetical protein